ncbi:MAG: OmpA family protein [Burkholderiales bacterium]
MAARKPARALSKRRFREVYFGHASIVLKARHRIRLRAYARYLVSKPQVLVALVGHRDVSETTALSTRLGRRRAAAVRAFLEHEGVVRRRITVASFADRMPLESPARRSSAAMNRRVDILYFGDGA